jgi:hypothetical protein
MVSGLDGAVDKGTGPGLVDAEALPPAAKF